MYVYIYVCFDIDVYIWNPTYRKTVTHRRDQRFGAARPAGLHTYMYMYTYIYEKRITEKQQVIGLNVGALRAL